MVVEGRYHSSRRVGRTVPFVLERLGRVYHGFDRHLADDDDDDDDDDCDDDDDGDDDDDDDDDDGWSELIQKSSHEKVLNEHLKLGNKVKNTPQANNEKRGKK